MEHESKYLLLKERHDKLNVKHLRVRALYDQLVDEHKDLSLFKVNSSEQLEQYSLREKVEAQSKGERQSKLAEVLKQLQQKKLQVQGLTVELERQNSKLTGQQALVANLEDGRKSADGFYG